MMSKPKIFVLIGPESTGKTTLAEELGRQLRIEPSREYARIYAETNNQDLTFQDVMPIAIGQDDIERNYIAGIEGNYGLMDTCLVSTYVYSVMYYNRIPEKMNEMIHHDRYFHFFLCFYDTEWTNDSIRNMPFSREIMHGMFEKELIRRNLSYTLIDGGLGQRIAKCMNVINNIL